MTLNMPCLISRNRRVLSGLAAVALVAFAWAQAARGQDRPQGAPPEALHEGPRRPVNQDGRLLRALNLTPEQRRQIDAIRREVAPQGRAAAARLRAARRALDEAIYADAPDETTVRERALELSAAQAAQVQLRALTELRIRRVLSPEQLNVFRELRRRALQRQLRHQGAEGYEPPAPPRRRLRERGRRPPQR